MLDLLELELQMDVNHLTSARNTIQVPCETGQASELLSHLNSPDIHFSTTDTCILGRTEPENIPGLVSCECSMKSDGMAIHGVWKVSSLNKWLQ